MVVESRGRHYASIARSARAVASVGFLLFGVTCSRTDPADLTPSADTAAVRGDAYRYSVDAACTALISRAAAMPGEREPNRMARQCAYRADLRIRQQAQELLRAQARKMGEVMIGIPEFHDEQRLPIAGGKLGPKTGLYLSPYLAEFRHRWQLENHPSPGVLAAYVVVMQEGNESFPPEYSELGLQWGVNCLYIETMTGGYKATMVKATSNVPCRDHNGAVAGPKTSLSVTASALGGTFDQDSMVPAARFQEDNEGRALFGVPCLNEWCQVTRPGKTPQKDSYCDWQLTDNDPVLKWTCDGKEMLVPSWFDEQMLDDRSGNDWVSTGTRAAIVPEPDIEKKSEADFSIAQHVATIYVRTSPDPNGKYHRSGLRKGANKVELRRGPSGFEFIITEPGGSSRSWPVLGPHKHYDAPIPGTSRWRFTVRDLGIWGPCGQNCCDSDGFQ